MEDRRETCAACYGRGHPMGWDRDCPVCLGRGTIRRCSTAEDHFIHAAHRDALAEDLYGDA